MSRPLVAVDGRAVRRALDASADVVVVGSGPAGATVAERLAANGLSVAVLEEGHEARPEDFPASAVRAMSALYRDMGTLMAVGNCPMPVLQGVAVGGTSVVNGAICWQMPAEVLTAWHEQDAALRDALPHEAIERAEGWIESRLNVHSTQSEVAGAKNLLLARGAEALGVAHRPIRRNVEACLGSGRCIQGCPHGRKLSVDRTLLPDAVEHGAQIFAGVRVAALERERGRACGVVGRAPGGGRVRVHARHAVVLAASAIQTPCLLWSSGLRRRPVGDGLSGHPGVSVTARFREPVVNHRGATQGHEVTGYRAEGIKLEALGFDVSILAGRIPGVGSDLMKRCAEMDRYAVWGAALRASARGSVRPVAGQPLIRYSLTDSDVELARRGVERLCETFFAAGAEEVYPGVAGFEPVLRDPRRISELARTASLDARSFAMSVTHLFGTARMGSDPSQSVVGPDFQHHDAAGLYVADSSVFPTNLGVNPQIPIMAMAALCAEKIVARR